MAGFMTELSFTPVPPKGATVELTLNEDGPVLKLETVDGKSWTVSRTWGSMSPFDEHTPWNVLVSARKEDLKDELLSAYPTRDEYAILMYSTEGGRNTDDALLLLRLWIKFFRVDDNLRCDLIKRMRRGMLNPEDSESEPKPKPRRVLN